MELAHGPFTKTENASVCPAYRVATGHRVLSFQQKQFVCSALIGLKNKPESCSRLHLPLSLLSSLVSRLVCLECTEETDSYYQTRLFEAGYRIPQKKKLKERKDLVPNFAFFFIPPSYIHDL